MKTRLITSFLGAILFFVVLLSPPLVFQIAVVIVAGVATYEIYSVTGLVKKLPLAVFGALGTLWCALLGASKLENSIVTADVCTGVLTVYAGIILALMVFDHKEISLGDAAIGFFVPVAIGTLLSGLIPLRAGENAVLIVVALFAATWCGDGGAYFVGIKFGKHKLAPVLSPKKTVEGAFGGVLGSVVGMIIYSLVLNYIIKVPCNEAALILVGIGCAVLGPVSDIAMSSIKREYGVKDYGNIFPGHGGILDRFDSVLLTTPFVCFVHELVKLIG